jgi:TolB protein
MQYFLLRVVPTVQADADSAIIDLNIIAVGGLPPQNLPDGRWEEVPMKRRTVLLTLAATTLLAVAVTGSAQAKVFGPNGQIVFSRFDNKLGDEVLYAVNPDGTHLHRVIPGPPIATECPHWSPDGSLIAACATSPDGVAQLINPDTGASQVVPAIDPTLNLACVVWSPDAKRFACGNFDVAADPDRDGLYTVRSSDGSDLKRLTSNPGSIDEPGDYSPNGKQIVFNRTDPTRPATANNALFVVNVDGTGLHRITPWNASGEQRGLSDGSWSPNGTTILYGDLSGRSLFTVHPDGSGLAKVPLATTGFSFPFGPSWSPDGTRIVLGLFIKTSPGTGQEGIYTANADGSDVQPVTSSSTFDSSADWGPHPLVT